MATVAAGASLYVNASTGDDSRSKVQAASPSTPWATLGRAVWGSTNRAAPNASEAASAGDVVSVAAGTYTDGTGTRNRFDVWYNPVNSGTSGNLITFQGYVSEPLTEGPVANSVVLRLTSGTGPVIGSDGKDYIKWVGFNIDELNASPTLDTGSVVLHNCTGCEIQYCQIKGDPDLNPVTQDNHCGIRCEDARFYTLSWNRLWNFGLYSTYEQPNSCGIQTYDSHDGLIEHNLCYRNGVGIFIKGQHQGFSQADITIRYNAVREYYANAIQLLTVTRCYTYQNLVYNGVGAGSSPGVKIGQGSPVDVYVVNNTIDGGVVGIQYHDCADATGAAQNNLVSNQGYAAIWSDTIPAPPVNMTPWDRNDYSSNTRHFEGSSNGVETFAQWQANYSVDANGITTDPQYVNAASRDYHLQGGSPASTLGRTMTVIHGSQDVTIPAGCYITSTETMGVG